MKKFALGLLPSILMFCLTSFGQVDSEDDNHDYTALISRDATLKPSNLLLKAELDKIGASDQQYRRVFEGLTTEASDSLAEYYSISKDSVSSYIWKLQAEAENGYPGKTMVGEPTNEVAFYVIQHSDKIAVYLPLLKKEARKREIKYTLVAMMEDRWLVEQGKDQIYGTQLWGNPVKDSLTGETKPMWFFNPVKDPANLNKRRKEAGFDETIEEYAEAYGIPFRMKKCPWQK